MAKDSNPQLEIAPSISIRMPSYEKLAKGSERDPNGWFAAKFPDAAKQYGPAFLEGTWADRDGFTRFIPITLNEDFFAAILAGDKRLGHKVVYHASEETFYFFDYRMDAYCPTSEDKLKLLLSNYLVRCSQECTMLVDVTNLVIKFRQDDTLKRVIEKATALLEADRLYFEGEHGHRRYVDGRYIEPNEEPSYQLFVKRAIVRLPEGKVTVQDAFHRYYQFCKDNAMQPLTRPEFKDLVAEVIREQYNLGLRHDVLNAQGKQSHGWHGIDCRLDVPALYGQN